MSLASFRSDLDALDDELIELLARRASLVEQIWKWKTAEGLPRVDPQRETALHARLLQRAESLGLSRDAVAAVLAQIVGRPLK